MKLCLCLLTCALSTTAAAQVVQGPRTTTIKATETAGLPLTLRVANGSGYRAAS